LIKSILFSELLLKTATFDHIPVMQPTTHEGHLALSLLHLLTGLLLFKELDQVVLELELEAFEHSFTCFRKTFAFGRRCLLVVSCLSIGLGVSSDCREHLDV